MGLELALMCWLHMEGKYLEFSWTMKSPIEYNAIDLEVNKLFVFEIKNSKTRWTCERIKELEDD